jgi:hypothetical protein
MPNAQQVPSLVIRLVCDSIIDNLGEKSLRLLFAQAKLQRYYNGTALPPDDESPSATVDELSTLFATCFRIFGDRGFKPILLRVGRNMLQHFRQTNKPLAALAGAAFTVLPVDAKIKLILSRSAKVGEELLHTPHQTYTSPEGYFVVISSCPYCVGTQAKHGICYLPVGFYGEAVRWATGNTYTVEEVECVAAGGKVCRFRVNRAPQ